MARLARLFVTGEPQLVLLRGNSGQAVFRDDADYLKMLQCLRDAVHEHHLACHAYVLMPEHLHLLVSADTAAMMGAAMQAIGRCYGQSFNRKYQRNGTLWEGRYRSTVIDGAAYLLRCSLYIEQNPVRAGLVAEPDYYSWSSFAHHAGLRADPLVTDHASYWSLGNTPFERQGAYRQLASEPLAARDLERIRLAGYKGWALGDEMFLQRLSTSSNRRAAPLARGRPRRPIT